MTPSIIYRLAKCMNISIPLQDWYLQLFRVLIPVAGSPVSVLFFENQPPFLAKRSSYSKINATVASIILIGMQITPISTIAVQIHH